MIKKHKTTVKGMMLVAAAVAVMLGTTAFAAYKFMTLTEIVERAGYPQIADALTDDDGTQFDIPPQQCGDYTIELLGIITGKNLSNFTSDIGNDDRSYIIGTISKTDGTPMTDYSGMMLTPLVSGYKPWEVNVFTLGGGKTEFIENEVNYFVYECDSIEMFADHTVYIALYGNKSPDGDDVGFAPSSDIFTMEDDGSIRFADGFKGQGTIFTVPLDKSRADPQKSEAFLKEIAYQSDTEDTGAVSPDDADVTISVSDGAEIITEVMED